MGLNKSENAGMVYLSVANGKLVQEHKEPTSNTIQRTNKKGRIVHEEFFKDLTGVITKITTKENDFGKQWQIVFTDGDDKYMVQMQYSGRYSSSFLKALPNVDAQSPVRFMPWEMTDKNDSSRKVTGVTLYQFGIKIPPAYTKEDPNGLPEMKKVKVKGKDTYDDSDMMEFLEEVAKSWISAIPAPSDEDIKNEEAPF